MKRLNLVLGVKMPDRDTIVLEGRTFKAVVEDVVSADVPQTTDQVSAQTSPEAPVPQEPVADQGTQDVPVDSAPQGEQPQV